MENLSLITLVLAAATLLVTIYLAFRLKAVLYLLQQPVVKKMSPQLRLKPVKLDEAMDRNRNRGDRDSRPPRDGVRPERGDRRDGDRNRDVRPERSEGRRDGRPERSEGPRPEGDRNRDGRPPREGGDRRDGRPPREGGDRDRNRDSRPPREGGDRRDGDRNRDSRPPREFSESREPRESAPAPQPSYAAPAAEAPAGLPPRRPLPSFSDAPSDRHEEASSAPVRESSSGDGFVGSNSDDLQHGRRTQLKKKPRFDFEEEEPTTPAT